MKIRFLQDVKYDGGGQRQDAYAHKAGDVVEMGEASAMHWVTRGKAEPVTEDVAPPAARKAQQSPPANKAMTAGQVQNKATPPADNK